ncbi:MAG: poly-gamma-glutamate system protein [bacterium]
MAYILLIYILPTNELSVTTASYNASQKMAKAISVIRDYLAENNTTINKKIDPNLTGLIGRRQTSLTTSLGHLQAKRTTTNPNFAGLIVHLLSKAGVQKGDKVAIGSSASFPGLMIATVCAAEAIGAEPIIILSLGSSSYGANHPDFNLLHMYEILLQEGIFSYKPSAVSLGGEDDAGKNMDNQLKQTLINQIQESNLSFIFENDLRKSVQKRLRIYKMKAGTEKIDIFINCGGSVANLGTSSLILKVKPGLIKNMKLPEKNKRGVLFEMASKEIPCIHLLYIQGLIQNYNLEWDPIPLPEPRGYSPIKRKNGTYILTLIIGLFYIIIIGIICYK